MAKAPPDNSTQSRGGMSPEQLLRRTVRVVEERTQSEQSRRIRNHTADYAATQAERATAALAERRVADNLYVVAQAQNDQLQQENAQLREQTTKAKQAIAHLLNRSASLRRSIEHMAAAWSPDQVAAVEALVNEELQDLEQDPTRQAVVETNAEALISTGIEKTPLRIEAKASPRRPKL